MRIFTLAETKKLSTSLELKYVYIDVKTLMNRSAKEALSEVNFNGSCNIPVLPFREEVIEWGAERSIEVRKKLLARGRNVKPLNELNYLNILVPIRAAVMKGGLYLHDILLDEIKAEYKNIKWYKHGVKLEKAKRKVCA